MIHRKSPLGAMRADCMLKNGCVDKGEPTKKNRNQNIVLDNWIQWKIQWKSLANKRRPVKADENIAATTTTRKNQWLNWIIYCSHKIALIFPFLSRLCLPFFPHSRLYFITSSVPIIYFLGKGPSLTAPIS